MLSLLKTVIVLALLSVPILVVTNVTRVFELVGSVPSGAAQSASPTPTPAFRLVDTTPTVRSRFAPVGDTPPPTLSAPAPVARPNPVVTPSPGPTGEKVIVGNTGGLGAVLRSEPVTGRPVAALREQQVLDVLEHRAVAGSGDWLHVRTADGVEGWVTGVVAQPVPGTANH